MALPPRRLTALSAALSGTAALLLLNASLAFQNVWPTPAIIWHGEVSVECAVLVLALAAVVRSKHRVSPAAIHLLAGTWVVLTLGHYADVTAPALYGRDINLYWDVRYMPDVVAMVAHAAPWWLVGAAAGAVAALVVLLYAAFRWALRALTGAMVDARMRSAAAIIAAGAIALLLVQPVAGDFSPTWFATPVTQTYARQARLIAGAMRASTRLPPSPSVDSDLAAVQGADVFLIFVESYGALAFERPDIAPYLAPARAQFDAAVRDTRRSAVSAFVDSPTFGGSSWLAHISLMSGIEVRDPETNARLMTEKRETLVTTFSRHGFRTIALMPGLRQRWPEGNFYNFDELYGAARLDYRGPEFGWFALPDQFTLARFDTLEVDRLDRPNLFVFYPTISTHFPFNPTPPYQPAWNRMLDRSPYDGPAIVKAYAKQPDWTHFAAGYVDAVTYTYQTLAGYLRQQASRDIVFIILGDHQPAAAVSGENASWSVPVHVVASRAAILDFLVARGFHRGLVPAPPPLGRMHALLPILLDAFSGRRRSAPSSGVERGTRGVFLPD